MTVGDMLREVADVLRPRRVRFALAPCGIVIGMGAAVTLSAMDKGLDFLSQSTPASAALSLAEITWLAENMGALRVMLIAIVFVSTSVGALALSTTTHSSVIERRAEIEMRRAIGATSVDIARAVVLTSLIVCLAAAVLGIALGLLAAFGIVGGMTAELMTVNFAPVLDPGFLLVLLGDCVLLGIGAGIFPAYRAVNLGVSTES
ncbi:MAG: FtsX-like permease family protein [Coriobacteriales bacterium]|jgi:ABC-type antimicrobial peptide transport system permease subunit|nr:FtsX-like permease family protein [Coriobacteriales bacterium]